MSVFMPTAADISSLMASQVTLTLLRSLSDEQWATVEQIAEATDYSDFVVTTELAALRAGGIIETLGELHRLDTAKVKEGFAMIATHFTQELRAA